ncbi:hypothetical protein ADK49_07050, partial [Streptomyces sp. WM6349]
LSLPVRFAPRTVASPAPQLPVEQPAGHPAHPVIPPQPTAPPAVAVTGGRRRRGVSWWRRLFGRG